MAAEGFRVMEESFAMQISKKMFTESQQNPKMMMMKMKKRRQRAMEMRLRILRERERSQAAYSRGGEDTAACL